MRVGLRKIREIIGWLNLPNEIQWLLYVFRHYMLPAVAAGMTGTYTVFQDAPLWQVAVVVGASLLVYFCLASPQSVYIGAGDQQIEATPPKSEILVPPST